MPTALFCTGNSWFSSMHVGAHHLAKGLARRGWKTAFVGDPVSPLHVGLLARSEIRSRLRLYLSGGCRPADNIWAWVPGTLLTPYNKPLLRSPIITRYWHIPTLPSLNKTLCRAGFRDFDLIYIDSPVQAYWWKTLPHKRAIYRLADNPAGFSDKCSATTMKALRDACASADLVLYTAKTLRPLADSLKPHATAFLPNGVDVAHFIDPAPCPPEYTADPRPKIVYAGTLERWFLFDWIRQAAQELSGAVFMLLGAAHTARKHLADLPNVRLLGPKPFSRLPGYLQHASVGIIPFDAWGCRELIEGVNPLKLYEYLAAGLPVVASRWKELEQLDSPAVLVDSAKEFITAVAAALAADKQKNSARQQFAQRFDWGKSVDRLIRLAAG